ncbi:MAG: SURF1 family protein [Burkholderiaceae bacterium]
MTRLRRPRVIPTLAMLAGVALTTSLGFWQLDRARQKLTIADAARAALAAPPVEVRGAPMAPAEVAGRQLRARGHWLPERAVFLDNRTHEGRSGFQVFMPLQLDGHAEGAPWFLLVQRGWVPGDPAHRGKAPVLEVAGDLQDVTGLAVLRLQQALQIGEPAPPAQRGRIWQAVSLEDFATWSGLRLQPFLLRESEGPRDGIVREWPRPGDDVSMHRGYAFQWFAMALATVAFWAWASFWRREDDRLPPS